MNGQMRNYDRYLKSLEGMEEPVVPEVILTCAALLNMLKKKA